MEHFDIGVRLLDQTPFSITNLDEAIAEFDKAILQEPQLARAYHKRAWAYVNKGRSERAIEDYDEAIRLDPLLAEAYVDRGLVHWAHGSNLADGLLRSGHFEKSIQDCDEAIRLDHELPRAYLIPRLVLC